ncbi:MAG: dihydroorotase [Bdellovibrionota bacterium]|nr:MAG: dihydroorotase [Bdellovibrionota bacterium]
MTVVRNGRVVDPSQGLDGERDILVRDGKVAAIDRPGSFASLRDEETIDATGMLVTPGFIDLHVHLREPGFEWKETVATGSDAAALGGFTTICCMANTNPVNDCAEITRCIIDHARAHGRAHVLPIGSISKKLEGKEMSPLSELARAGCVAFSDDGEPVKDAGLMRRALEWASMLGLTLSCHEEDKSLSCGGCMNESALSTKLGLKGMPKVAEEVMIARDIELARTTGARVHICHVSSGRGVELIRRAKNDGIQISAEVTPHHLMLTEDAVTEYDTNAKMSPPLREAFEVEALRRGLADGTIDAVASDHAPHELDSKRVEFSRATFGIIGLQTSLPILLELERTGVLSLSRAIESITSGPAKVFGLQAGSLRIGQCADLVVLDMGKQWQFSREHCCSKSFNTPFADRLLQGKASSVLLAGKTIVREERFVNGEA